jgi:hypothetical protein
LPSSSSPLAMWPGVDNVGGVALIVVVIGDVSRR